MLRRNATVRRALRSPGSFPRHGHLVEFWDPGSKHSTEMQIRSFPRSQKQNDHRALPALQSTRPQHADRAPHRGLARRSAHAGKGCDWRALL
jgi:hypothetical protein